LVSRRAYVGGLFGLAATMLLLGLARPSTAGHSRDGVFDEDVVRRVRDWILNDYVEELDDFDMKLYSAASGSSSRSRWASSGRSSS